MGDGRKLAAMGVRMASDMAGLDTERRDPKRVTILGSTGSVGCSTIDLIKRNPDAFQVEALTAGTRVRELARQAKTLGARAAVVADEKYYGDLKEALRGTGIEAQAGEQAIIEAAERPVDFVMAAIVGAAGLAPTFAAIRQGAAVGLANKESLVCAGGIMIDEVRTRGATLLPVDSEHNAIFQVFDFERSEEATKIILTASGGPFRECGLDEMRSKTPAQAVAHPNWNMGAKISIDSATMMNKGLELIEAYHLFPLPEEKIEILVHPQSVIHSMVEYVDGSVLAQLGSPDMRTPISHAMNWPRRGDGALERLDFAKITQLTFHIPDENRFPALKLARQALKQGGVAPIALNAANEVAVAAFLLEKIGFLDIVGTVEAVLDRTNGQAVDSIEAVVEADRAARRLAQSLLRS